MRANRTRGALLSRAEEAQLARELEAGRAARDRIDSGRPLPGDERLVERGVRARHRFVEANLGLVHHVVSRMPAPGHVERSDLVQDGIVGLDRAITKFDWRRGYKFSTYATWWIRQSIQRGMERSTTIRIPTHRALEVRTARRELPASAELPPALAAVAAMFSTDSIDRPAIDGAATIAELVPAVDPGPEEVAERRAERQAIEELLHTLDPVTAEAIVARFGLGGDEPATYTEIARRLDVTPEAVRRRVKRALVALRDEVEARGLASPVRAA